MGDRLSRLALSILPRWTPCREYAAILNMTLAHMRIPALETMDLETMELEQTLFPSKRMFFRGAIAEYLVDAESMILCNTHRVKFVLNHEKHCATWKNCHQQTQWFVFEKSTVYTEHHAVVCIWEEYWLHRTLYRYTAARFPDFDTANPYTGGWLFINASRFLGNGIFVIGALLWLVRISLRVTSASNLR